MSDTLGRMWWMSVALTTQAVRDRIKTQTRRDGCCACEQVISWHCAPSTGVSVALTAS